MRNGNSKPGLKDAGAGLVFLQGALMMLELVGALVLILVILYVIVYILKQRRFGTGIGKNKCGICGHKVTFLSECCQASLKYMSQTATCTKCRKMCDVVCEGCDRKKCQPNCEKCVRKML
jgi:hypothetical protein